MAVLKNGPAERLCVKHVFATAGPDNGRSGPCTKNYALALSNASCSGVSVAYQKNSCFSADARIFATAIGAAELQRFVEYGDDA